MKTTPTHVSALLFVLGLGLTGLTAQDQNADTAAPPSPPPGGGGMRGGGMMMPGLAQLDLTADQKAKFADLGRTMMESMKALRDDDSLSPQEKRAKMGEIVKQMETDSRALLTPEQQAKLDEFRKTHPGMGRPGRGRPMDLQALLELTDDQKAKMAEIRTETTEQIKALRDDTSLSPEDVKAKTLELQKAGQEKFKAILTPEQLQKYNDGMQRMTRPQGGRGAWGPPPEQNAPESNSGGNAAPTGGVM